MAQSVNRDSVGAQYNAERVITEFVRLFLAGCFFSIPARVISVNVSKQSVDVQPSLMKLYPKTGLNIPRPVLQNVPFQFQRGGDSYITIPIKPGDEGILIFAQRDIRSWKELGGIQQLRSSRMFDYNDAIFIPGISSFVRAVSSYDPDNITIVKNGKKITVGDGTLDAPDYAINCKSLHATGTIESDSDCISAGISGKGHVHGGVESGGSSTGGPQ